MSFVSSARSDIDIYVTKGTGLSRSRSISYTEIERAMSCQAKWSYSYGDQLAGCSLKPKEIAPILSDGRAWGAAVAAWHSLRARVSPLEAAMAAIEAMDASFAADRLTMAEAGIQPNLENALAQRDRLEQIFGHYIQTVEPLPNLTRLEGEIEVPLRSRKGGTSNRYRFQCFIDGYTIGAYGAAWIVEFKLRGSLHDAEQINLNRQPRWYAWAFRELQRRQGNPVDLIGVLVDERFNEVPKPARVLKNGRPSHAKDQLTTHDSYLELCLEKDEGPKIEVLEVLKQRRWQQRIPILFRPGELDEAGDELVSAARLINQLDTGELFPVRNASPMRCRSCDYRKICAEPDDQFLVDVLFERRPPKKDRQKEQSS